MAFIVRNHPEQKDELARALRAIASDLRSDADTIGESRSGRVRIAFFDPLVIDFAVAPADRKVEILSVRLRGPLY
ncbi:unnamed protein product [Gemmataceae bacterium]|jgi:hypothetical protein|nr:unnamed protein product [Gemmataceae bacterium]VTT98057.1 unnamed protein product [Gemmataceae bacterium]